MIPFGGANRKRKFIHAHRMFYFFSKVLNFLLMPYSWLTILLLVTLLSKHVKVKKVSMILFVTVFFFFSNSVISTMFMAKWEYPAVDIPKQQQYEYGIMLGGVTEYDSYVNRLEFNASSDRFLQTIRLYETKVIKKIILSGGEGSLVKEGELESLLLRDYLLGLGIPEKDIIVEPYSQNTHENAEQTALLLQKMAVKGKCLLITSAIHLRRAEACFQKQGVEVDSYAVDRHVLEDKVYSIGDYLLPNSGAVEQWKVLLHELIGYIMYMFMGYV